jgi:hypothetical protein
VPIEFEKIEGIKFEEIISKIEDDLDREMFITHYLKDRDSGDYFLKEHRTKENEQKIIKILKSIHKEKIMN